MKYLIRLVTLKLIPTGISKKLGLIGLNKFDSYQEALQYCSGGAYEQEQLIKLILEKTIRYAESLDREPLEISATQAYSLLALIKPITNQQEVIKVLDFGGACGAHYFHIRKMIDKHIRFQWVVVETPTMVKYAKTLENDELSFVSDMSAAQEILGQIDIVHASGVLHFVDEPFKYLQQIVDSGAQCLLLHRLGLNEADQDIVALHYSKLSWNGHGALPEGYQDRWIQYPCIFVSEQRFLRMIKSKYDITMRFEDSSGTFSLVGEQTVGYGMVCQLREDVHT